MTAPTTPIEDEIAKILLANGADVINLTVEDVQSLKQDLTALVKRELIKETVWHMANINYGIGLRMAANLPKGHLDKELELAEARLSALQPNKESE